MNEKEIDPKPEEDDSDDFGINIHYHQEDDEDIPFPENWKRESVKSMKNTICDWIDHNVEHEYKTNPDIYSKEDERRLYFKIQEEGGSDRENDGDGYFCVFEKYDTRKVEDTDVEFQ